MRVIRNSLLAMTHGEACVKEYFHSPLGFD